MMSPRPGYEDRYSVYSRQTPLRIVHILGNFMRIWSIYSMYHYLSQTGSSGVLFIFSCLVPASIIFLVLQKPWKGRPLSNTQVVPSMINGAITALYFILWVKGVKSCGPLRAILAEYSGAVLGVLSAVLYGSRGHMWKKVGGLVAMLASLYFLSQGWTMATYSPFSFRESMDSDAKTKRLPGVKEMVVPMFAGILSAFRRVIGRRISIKNQLKRRLHAITIASATCFMFPVAMWDVILGTAPDSSRELHFATWPYLSTVLFAIVLIFYVENVAEERLHMVFSSPKHLMVAGGCIIVMEIMYKMDFSLPGFLICCAILGFGIYEATSVERTRQDSHQSPDLLEGPLEDLQMSSLPT